MYSSCQLQFSELLKRLLLSSTFDLLGTYFPSEILLEGKHTPRYPWFYMLSLQAQQYQIGHDGHRYRMFDSRGVLGDLCLAQSQPALQFLETEFHRPPSEMRAVANGRVVTSNLVCLGQGQMRDDIAQMLAVGQLPGARESNDKEPPSRLNGLEICPRGIGGIGHHDQPFAPRGQHEALKHFSKEGVFRPIAFTPFGFQQPKGQRNTVDIPLGNEQDHMQPKGIGGIFIEAPFFGQGILFGALALQGAIHHQEQHSITRRWKSRQGLGHQPLQYLLPRPARAGHQPAQVPSGHMPGGVAAPSLEGGFLKTDELRHHQPTKDQKMTVAEQELEGKKKTLYFVRQTSYLDHGWPFWERMKGWLAFPLFLSSGRPASKSPPFLSRTLLLPQYRNKSLFKIDQPVNFEYLMI
jgi:hypothetical protein